MVHFYLQGKVEFFEEPTRTLLPECLKKLQVIIQKDWTGYKFDVIATEDDQIAIRFDIDTVESERGLKAYMNVLAATNDSVQRFQLQRVIEDWGTKPGDGWLYYIMKPPWCRAKSIDTFFALNPDSRIVNDAN